MTDRLQLDDDYGQTLKILVEGAENIQEWEWHRVVILYDCNKKGYRTRIYETRIIHYSDGPKLF